MILGIKPTVDFAFKKIFGSPQNVAALIGLLNAILDLKKPIVSVEILNPFSYQEFADSKLIVLDVRCRDSTGRYMNVELEISVYAALIQRLTNYVCSMHVDQLSKGDSYASLAQSISICLLSHALFPGSPQAHHCFEIQDQRSGRKLDSAIEVHTVELTKYNLGEETISQVTKLDQRAFLLRRAQDYDAATLRRLMPGIEFETASETIKMISEKTEDKQTYDQREKAQRDYEWAPSGAREASREEGERLGVEIGKLAGKVQLLQELLGDMPSSDTELQELATETLAEQLTVLQQRIRDRKV